MDGRELDGAAEGRFESGSHATAEAGAIYEWSRNAED
jgi:hypothetical protein